MILEPVCKFYFELFSSKDVNKLSELFSDDIQLIDWDINIIGKKNVIDATKNIFDNVKGVLPINYYEYGSTICCEILVVVNETEKIHVMDVITFDKFMKIKKIIAYKR